MARKYSGNPIVLINNNQAFSSTLDLISLPPELTWSHRSMRARLIDGLVEGINGDLEHMCMGRSALVRLSRALQLADKAGLAVTKLREIYSQEVQ